MPWQPRSPVHIAEVGLLTGSENFNIDVLDKLDSQSLVLRASAFLNKSDSSVFLSLSLCPKEKPGNPVVELGTVLQALK